MAGDYDYGEDDYGDDVPELAPSPARPALRALFFDPATRQHAMDADGSFKQIHPVDAAVINALNIAREKFPPVGDTGAAFWKLGSAYEQRAQRKCEDWAKQALAELLSAKDIELRYVKHEPAGEFGSQVTVGFVNMRTYPRDVQTATVPT